MLGQASTKLNGSMLAIYRCPLNLFAIFKASEIADEPAMHIDIHTSFDVTDQEAILMAIDYRCFARTSVYGLLVSCLFTTLPNISYGSDFLEKRTCTLDHGNNKAPVHTTCIVSGGVMGGTIDVSIGTPDGTVYALEGPSFFYKKSPQSICETKMLRMLTAIDETIIN